MLSKDFIVSLQLSVKGCGSKVSCFRLCRHGPRCDSNEAEYMVTMEPEKGGDTMLFRMGGTLKDKMVSRCLLYRVKVTDSNLRIYSPTLRLASARITTT